MVKVQKISRHKKYSHGTVGSMSTVVQDLYGGRHALPAGDTRRSDIDSNVDCESDLKKNRLLLLFVKSEKQFCSKKKTLPLYSWVRVDLQDTHVDGVRSSLVRLSQRPGADSADQLFTVDLQLCKSALDCTSRLNSWDWVLVQVYRASSVPLWATIRMPTTIAISRKRSFTISADKTVVVARTLGACAVFFLVIATTTRLLWAGFGATLGQVRGRCKPFQAFFSLLAWKIAAWLA